MDPAAASDDDRPEDDGGAGDGDPGAGDRPRAPRLRWEAAEVLIWGILGGQALIVGAELAAGTPSSSPEGPTGLHVGEVLSNATRWAGTVTVLTFYLAIGMAAWQIYRWFAVTALDDPDQELDSEEEAVDADLLAEGLRRMARARRLLGLVAVALALTGVGAVTYLVGEVLSTTGFPSDPGVPSPWATYLFLAGATLLTLALVGAGLIAVRTLRAICRERLDGWWVDPDSGEPAETGSEGPLDLGEAQGMPG